MSTVNLRGSPVEVAGRFPQEAARAPAFTLVGRDLMDVALADSVVVLNEHDEVVHSELVSEIRNEPDY